MPEAKSFRNNNLTSCIPMQQCKAIILQLKQKIHLITRLISNLLLYYVKIYYKITFMFDSSFSIYLTLMKIFL